MHIAICEDNAADTKRLRQALAAVIDETDLDAHFSCFASGEALLAALADGYTPSICFLDIYMTGVSGVVAAREVKKQHPRCALVFVTSSPEHMADGYDIGAVHYLIKPVDKNGVAAALQRSLQAVGREARYVALMINRQSRRVLLSDILYAETQAKCCYLYVKSSDEPLRAYLKLDELEALLSSTRFLRCHHSFIVNLAAVAAPTEDNCFLLSNGAKVPIRQRGRKEILAAYNEYHFERLRRGSL